MNKDQLIITTIVVLGLMVGFVFILKDRNPPQIQSKPINKTSDLNLMMENNTLSISLNNTDFNGRKEFLDSLCEVIPMKDMVGNKAKLLIYIPEDACIPCFQEELTGLNDLIQILGESNVIELCSGKNYREALAVKKSDNLSCNIYFTNEALFPGKKISSILYGVIKPDLKIHDVYVTMKSYPEFSRIYINAIDKKYFKCIDK